MSVGQTIEAKIVVDAKQAQANVDAFNKSLSVVEQTAQSSGARLDALQKTAQGLQQKMAPAAAAISSVSSALGATGGAAGQAVAVLGQLAAAFGAGGPMAVALVATTTAIDKLTKAWDEEIKAQDEALRRTYASAEAAAKSLQGVRDELDKIRRANMPEEWQRSADAAQRLADVERRIAAEQTKLLTPGGRRRVGISDEERSSIESAIRLAEAEKVKIIELNAEIEKETKNRKIEAAQADFDAKRKQEEEKRLAKLTEARNKHNQALEAERVARASIQIAQMEEEEKQLRAVAEARKQAAAERDAVELQRMGLSLSAPLAGGGTVGGAGAGTQGIAGAQTEMQAMAVEAAKNAAMAEDWSLAWTRAGNDVAESFGGAAGAIDAAIGIATQGMQQYLDDVITGQEDAEAAFASSVMAQAGQALISYGTQLAGKAVMDAFTAPPLAAAEGVAAVGLIAAGIGLGGAATAVQHTAAGGTIGQALPTDARTDRGASPRTGGGGGSSGPFVLNISYGVGGPLPEDTAREIHRVMRTNDRRRGAA